MMRVLLMCTKYPLDPNDRYMTNELAGALVAAGHRVQVVVTDWTAPFGAPAASVHCEDGVDALVVSPRAIAGLGRFVEEASKWVLSSLFAWREMRRALGNQSFDVLVCFTPCVTVAAQLFWATNRWQMRNILFVHDFFPYHHRSIGLVPRGPVFEVAQWIEERLMRRFHVIGCMSPMNASYLRNHYRTRETQQITVHPIWGRTTPPPVVSRDAMRAAHRLPLDKKIVVFGGQITEGRGMENILAAAEILRNERPNIAFLFIGEGRLVEFVKSHCAKAGNVLYRGRIPREDYLSLISACDIGLVCTVAGVDVPSFPSKIIDYLRAELPVVAAIEETTDYGRFVEEHGLGTALHAGDPHALAEAVKRISDDPDLAARMAQAARHCLNEVFDVRRAVARIEDAVATVGV
jgi:glycosyltransferase involved in cell wall biosynthesis